MLCFIFKKKLNPPPPSNEQKPSTLSQAPGSFYIEPDLYSFSDPIFISDPDT